MKLLGMDGTEEITTSRYKTYCGVCSRLINRNERVYTWPGRTFLVHLNCDDPEVEERMTNSFFRENVKRRRRRNTRRGNRLGGFAPQTPR